MTCSLDAMMAFGLALTKVLTSSKPIFQRVLEKRNLQKKRENAKDVCKVKMTGWMGYCCQVRLVVVVVAVAKENT